MARKGGYNEDTGFFELKFIEYGNFNDTPNLIYENLKSGDLIHINGKLYVSDSKKYYKYSELDKLLNILITLKKVAKIILISTEICILL
ncbi:MAG: hypothetical protein ACK5LT_04440 [Lachnospirales bacterium]